MGLSSGWNLPPGCRDSDLPGNRPEDEEWDDFLDGLSEAEADLGEADLQDLFDEWRKARRDAETDRRIADMEDRHGDD